MRDIMRMIATTIIWGVLLAVIGTTLNGPTGPASTMDGGEIVALIAILMAGAVTMTYAIWHNGFHRADDIASSAQQAKLKRTTINHQDRIARLIDSLEDDDIYELEALLLNRAPQNNHTMQQD